MNFGMQIWSKHLKSNVSTHYNGTPWNFDSVHTENRLCCCRCNANVWWEWQTWCDTITCSNHFRETNAPIIAIIAWVQRHSNRNQVFFSVSSELLHMIYIWIDVQMPKIILHTKLCHRIFSENERSMPTAISCIYFDSVATKYFCNFLIHFVMKANEMRLNTKTKPNQTKPNQTEPKLESCLY